MSFIVEFSWLLVVIMIIAFACEFMDSSLGMGYGTTLTPVLLIFGFDTMKIVPAVLISEFVTGLVSAIFHAIFKNFKLGQKDRVETKMAFNPENLPDSSPGSGVNTSKSIKYEQNSFSEMVNNLTRDTKVVFILALFGVVGTIVSAVISVVFSYSAAFKFAVKIYIGVMVLAMGIIILIFRNRDMKFSYRKIVSLGVLAGFNKGLSGGGYGPITVSGQILAGRDGKNAIASTSLAESIVCFVGITAYVITNVVTMYKGGEGITWEYLGLAPYLMIGAVLSAPLAALTTKTIEGKWLKLLVGIVTVLLGIFTLVWQILQYTGVV
ncbi:MAG: sulfite exporter TauE/SafE family protein [Candidatus Thorarchaeota archaeon]